MEDLKRALDVISGASADEAPTPPRRPAVSAVFRAPQPDAHSLDIRPVKSSAQLDALDGVHENVIRPPFLILVSAGVRSGKSCLIANLVYRKEYYRDAFDRVILISPTAHADPTFEAFAEDPKCEIHAPSGPAELDASIEAVVKAVAPDGKPSKERVVLVIDDCAGFIRNLDALCSLATRYRHYKLSLIVSSQYYLRLPPILRTNATAIILFRIATTRERQTVFDELASSYGDHFEKIYDEVFERDGAKKYGFLVVDLRRRSLLDGFARVVYSHNP